MLRIVLGRGEDSCSQSYKPLQKIASWNVNLVTQSASTPIETKLRRLLTQVRMKKIECANKSKYAANPEQSQNLLGWVDALVFVEKEIENCLSSA